MNNLFAPKIYFILLGALITFVNFSSITYAQVTRNILYCCNNDAGQKICGDRRDQCWGRETQAVDERGIIVDKFPPPMTRSERIALADKEKAKLEAEKQAALSEANFRSLLANYGSPQAIDREIERQLKESEANIKITESKLQNARDNVRVCTEKLNANQKSVDCDAALLEVYKKTVVDIENEIKSRREQTETSKQQLLITKKEIEDYQTKSTLPSNSTK